MTSTPLDAKIVLLIIFLLSLAIVFAFLFWYIHKLQARFYSMCLQLNRADLFARAPAGVPEGTVRSLLALYIILAGVLLILLTVAGGPFQEFPEVLSGILGSVLGFYFGSRTAAAAPERAAAEEVAVAHRERDKKVAAAHQERDEATAERQTTTLTQVLDKVKGGLAVLKAASPVLPQAVRNRADGLIGRVEGGLKIIDELHASGDINAAGREADRRLAELRNDNPIVTLVRNAATSFAGVLGATVTPLSLIVTVAAIGTRLTGAAYERWLARVMNAPYTPALFPSSVIDANTALVLLRYSSGFEQAFAEEIQRGDRRFIKEFVELALSEEGSEALWRRYPERFDSLGEIDAALAQFQQAAIRLEVAKDIDSALAAEVGGVDELMTALDKINESEAARADMDALVLTMDELRRNDQPVERIFREVRQDLEEGP